MENVLLVLKDLTKTRLGGPTLNKVAVPFSHKKYNTMVAKRALNFGTPSSKRRRVNQPLVLYRSPKAEVKNFVYAISYSTVTSASYFINSINQGTAINERVGARIRIHKIDYVLAQSGGEPVRVDLLVNNVAGYTAAHAFTNSVDHNRYSLLSTRFLHSETSSNSKGCFVKQNLPYPITSKYTTGTGSTINQGQIVARLATPTNATITGYFRVYYTDS